MGVIFPVIIGAAVMLFSLLLAGKDEQKNKSSGTPPMDSYGFEQPKDHGKCDGNCANCPAHYGYRYGRWYYGHGHQHGCERGGNGGASGLTSRD